MGRDVINFGPLSIEPLNPDAECVICGARGTVAVTVLHTTPEQVRRFCVVCWPETRRVWEAERMDEARAWVIGGRSEVLFTELPKPPSGSTASRSWHDVVLYIDLFLLQPDGSPSVSLDELARAAKAIRAIESSLQEPMPAKIASFVAKYSHEQD